MAMDNIELIFNQKTAKWEERSEPYITVEIDTEEEYEWLKAAVAFYENREKYEKVVRCKECRFSKTPSPAVQKYGVPGTLVCENRNSPSNHRLILGDGYCPYGERKNNETG